MVKENIPDDPKEAPQQLTTHQALIVVQSRLKAPKNQYSKYGEFYYRSCEDILVAVKPLLQEVGATIIISDQPVLIGDRYYFQATAIFATDHGSVASTGYAREPLEKKKMDAAQVSGTASSYARKYALNGLLLIDDSKDSDVTTDIEASPPVSDDKILELETKITDNELDIPRLKKWMQTSLKVAEFHDLNEQGYKTVMDMVNRKIKAIEKKKGALNENH